MGRNELKACFNRMGVHPTNMELQSVIDLICVDSKLFIYASSKTKELFSLTNDLTYKLIFK